MPIITICFYLLFFGATSTVLGTIEIKSVEFGFNGHYKRDRWVPLHILVASQNEPGRFIGEVEVEVHGAFSGQPIQTYSTPLSLMPPTDQQRRVLYIFQPGISTILHLKLVDQRGQLRGERDIVPELPKEAADLFVLALTPNRDLLSRWNGKPIDEKAEGHIFVVYINPRQHLPTHWRGYDSVDLLVIRATSLTERYISPRQQTALLDWIQNGGTLLLSGGSDHQYLHRSFLEPFLPVHLGELKTAIELPASVRQFGFEADSPFNLIEFKPKREDGAVVLNDAPSSAYIVKGVVGSGQIICLAFDYNVPPFSESQGREKFWAWLLRTEGKSPRHLEARYAPYRKHVEKIEELLTSLPSTHAPLIRFLALFLSIYLLGFGGFAWWLGRRQRQSSAYWAGSFVITLLLSGVVILPRNFLPSSVSANRFSILSVYSERERAYLQTYLGIIASAHSLTTIRFEEGAFIKPLTSTPVSPFHLVEGRVFQLRQVALNPWKTSTYFVESFLGFPGLSVAPLEARNGIKRGGDNPAASIEHHLPGVLENAWLIDGNKHFYLGAIPAHTAIKIEEDSKSLKALPPTQGLDGNRKEFAQILASQGVLRYLRQESQPKLVGWLRQSLLPMELDHPLSIGDETFVILYLARGNEK